MKKSIYLITKILACFLLFWAITSCGSSSKSKDPDFIPPFVDPNGGPVLKIDVGNSVSLSKSKINTFQKDHTISVSVFKLDGTLIGDAVKIRNGLWQIQVNDNSPSIIKAIIKNDKGGIATLEKFLPITNTSTVSVNSETTKITYIAWLNAFLQSKDLGNVVNISGIASDSINDSDSLKDGNLLKILIDGLSATDTPAVQVSTAAIYVRKLIALYTVTKKVNEFLGQLESGSLTTTIPSSNTGMFASGGRLNLTVITAEITANEIKSYIENVISSLVSIKIVGETIIITSILSPTTTETVLLTLSAANILAMQSLFSISNTPPIFTSTPITTAIAGVQYSYTAIGSDGDGDTVTINTTTLPTWLNFNGSVLSGTPSTENIGSHPVVLSITDNKISSGVLQSFTITVSGTNSTNIAPVITSTAITEATESVLYQYTITATDAESDPLTFSVVVKPTWLNFSPSTGLLSGTPTDSNIGDHEVTLQVTDGNKSTQQSFTISVAPAPENQPPEFDPTGTLTATEGSLFSKTITATDPDGDTVTIAAKSLPAWLTFVPSTGVLSGIPANSDFTLNKVILTATDGIITTPVEITLTININTIPSFVSTPVKSVIAGQVYNYTFSAIDTDGDIVTITAPTLPAWLTFDTTTNTLTGAPTSDEIGVHKVILLASDKKAVASGKQEFSIQVLNDLYIAKVNTSEVTDQEIVPLLDKNVSLSIAERNSGSGLSFKIRLDGTELFLTNNATSVLLTAESQTVEFIAIDEELNETTMTVTLTEDFGHFVVINITGGTLINDDYRKIPGSITFSSQFQGEETDVIVSKTIQLDEIPQSLNTSSNFVLDPLTIEAGAHEITATISYIGSTGETLTASNTIDFILVENITPTQVVKIDSLEITSDTSFAIHNGTSVTITTTEHFDVEDDAITKGLIIDGVLNSDLTSYTISLATGETKTVKTYLKDPYGESEALTISLSASSINGGVPVSLSATGTKVTNSTTIFRDTVNGEPNIVTLTANLGIDSENDGVSLIEWLVNSVVIPNENAETFDLDLSTYGGTTAIVIVRVTDAFLPSPTITTATISLTVDFNNPPTFTSATLDGVAIALTAAISVDHTSNVNRVYAPIATDVEGDSFTYQYKLNSVITTGPSITIPFSTLTGSVLTVNLIQEGTIVATNAHNITANNVVPTPIIIGNTSHVDLNGNYSLIVRPGIDLEGDKLITTVTLNGNPISGVVVDNEIQYSVDLTALGGTIAVFNVTNNDNVSAPISVSFNVTVIQAVPPTGLTATRGSKQITLTWNSVSTATSYNLYYGTAINVSTGSTKVSTITSPYTLTGLTDSTTYYFRISANHVSAEGDLSGTDIPMTPHSAGDTLVVTVNAQAFTFKFIPAGSFTMGAPATETGFESGEGPQHVVTLSKEFWMLQNEVTQAQWSAIITGAHPSISTSPSFFVGATRPVEQVTWEDIMGTNGFISNLHLSDVNTVLTSGLYLLPTEAQWEYANRAGTTTRFYWGDDSALSSISTYAWYSGNATTTNVVNSKTANAWGLFDMSGNVSEWCLDKTPSAYTSAAVTDPSGAISGNERVFRGGSWFDSGNFCRAAKRFSSSKDIFGTNLGFRFIRVPLPTE